MVNLIFISIEFNLDLVESLDLGCNGGFYDYLVSGVSMFHGSLLVMFGKS